MDNVPLREKLSRLVDETRVILRHAIDRDFKDEEGYRNWLRESFHGYCGLAQCVAGYALQQAGAVVHPLATQSLDNNWFGHAALTVTVNTKGEDSVYLVDPTFRQFCMEDDQITYEDNISPGAQLDKTFVGRVFKKEILEFGFAELTPARAALYLSSFCKGESFAEDTAFEFCKNPPPHGYHFKYDYNSDRFSPENLARQGDIIRDFKL